MGQQKEDFKVQKNLVQEVKFLKNSESESTFDIIEFCKSTRIQISPFDYLKSNPNELD